MTFIIQGWKCEGSATKIWKYKQDILREIDEGKFKPGSKIYSEGDLKRIYNVSNTTVVKALNDLVAGGFLIRKQGKGPLFVKICYIVK